MTDYDSLEYLEKMATIMGKSEYEIKLEERIKLLENSLNFEKNEHYLTILELTKVRRSLRLALRQLEILEYQNNN